MSNKNIPNPEAMPVVQRESTTLNGITSSSLKSSPLFGWLFAGSDLLSAKLDQAAGVVSQKIDNTQETIGFVTPHHATAATRSQYVKRQRHI